MTTSSGQPSRKCTTLVVTRLVVLTYPLRETREEERTRRKKKEPRLVSKLPNRGTDEFLKNIVLYVTERTRKREKKKRKKGLDSETPSASQGCKEQKKKKKQ